MPFTATNLNMLKIIRGIHTHWGTLRYVHISGPKPLVSLLPSHLGNYTTSVWIKKISSKYRLLYPVTRPCPPPYPLQ